MQTRTNGAMSNDVRVSRTSDLGDGIAQIRLPMAGNPLRYINAYVVRESDGLTIVDCGWKADDVLAAMHAGLYDFGHELADVRRVLITHHHYDHYGLAATLRRHGVPDIMMSAIDWERARSLGGKHADDDLRSDAWLARNGFVAAEPDEDRIGDRREIVEPTQALTEGARVGRLVALWTPGHSPGHLCFAVAGSSRMLTGDHVLDPITPHVGVWRENDGDPLGAYLRSLERVRTYGADDALPAHGEPFSGLPARAAELMAHTGRRDAHVLSVLGEHPSSAGDIARRMTWTRRERAFATLGAFHQQFAVAETIAHLHHLAAIGRVARVAGSDPIRYAM